MIKALVFDFYEVLGLSPAGWEIKLNQELVDWIHAHASKYKLGLISNADSNWLKPYLKQHKLKFDVTVISSEVGFTKPDARIYQHALSQLKVEPEAAVFIDDIAQYVEAAQQEGMQGIVYDNNQQLFTELKKLGVE